MLEPDMRSRARQQGKTRMVKAYKSFLEYKRLLRLLDQSIKNKYSYIKLKNTHENANNTAYQFISVNRSTSCKFI